MPAVPPVIAATSYSYAQLFQIQRLLEDFGLEAVSFLQIPASVPKIAALLPDVVVVTYYGDYLSADRQFLRALRAERGMETIPIILCCSQRIDASDSALLGTFGDVRIIYDAIKSQELIEVLQEALGKRGGV